MGAIFGIIIISMIAVCAILFQMGHVWIAVLAICISPILANPDPVLFQLLNVAQSDGCAKDEIVTRSHHLKISVIKISDDRFFWRIENLGQKENAYGRHRDLLNIPLLTVGARGAVLFANEACRSFLGYRPKTVSDFLGDKEPVSGMSATITGAQGVVSFNIAKITDIKLRWFK